jgi:hypothetical protein
MEKNDLELMKSKLSSILLGDALKPIEQLKGRPIESGKGPVPVSVASGLPEPPVVVYVKEIGKAGL